MAEDGGEEFVVQEVADVTTGHFSGRGGGSIESLGAGEKRVGKGGSKDGSRELQEAGTGDKQNPEIEEFLRVTNFFGKKEEKAAGDQDYGKQVRAESEEKEKDAAEVGSGRTDQVGFGLLGGLRVEGEVLGIEGE